MRTPILALAALAVALPTAAAYPAGEAQAQTYKHKKRHAYKEWRGRDGRTYCRRPDGTTGLVVGAAAGALLGRTIDTRGDRTGGTLVGAVAGALAGREIERSGKRCR